MKLVFVEGIPGFGNSSTARFIVLQLEGTGILIYEKDIVCNRNEIGSKFTEITE